jgi:hypothetical protein
MGPPKQANVHNDWSGVAAPLLGEVVGWRLSSSFFVPQAHSRLWELESHIIYVNQRGFSQGCAFWESRRYIPYDWIATPQKTHIFGTPVGISSLHVYCCISAQKKQIITLYGLKCASQQNTQCAIRKRRGWGHFRGQNYTFPQNSLQCGFQVKTTCCNNCQTVRPILTNSTPINPAQQM